jgi:hypothetical protein
MSAVEVVIAGTDRTAVVDLQTLEVEDAVGERSVARFHVTDLDGSLASVIVPGSPVEISLDGTAIFGGTVDRVRRQRAAMGASAQALVVDCADWHQLCDRRIVSEAYSDTTAGAVVRALLTGYLAAEGVTEGNVQDGPPVAEAVFNYVPVTRALDALSERAGFAWWIDAAKRLHFVDRATYSAPWPLEPGRKWGSLRVNASRQGYRNRQYVRAGKDLTDEQVETFKGDGARRTFTLGYPIAQVPTVAVNGIAKTVGIKGIDTSKDWYWNKGDAVLTQDEGDTPLTASDILEVTYRGWYDVVVLVTDEAEITLRQAVEGGSGWYEVADDEPYLGSATAAIQWANARLRRYARMPTTITFDTWEPGLRPGQLLTVDVPDLGLAGDYLIEEVRLSYLTGQDWLYSVRAVSGEAVGGWVPFFRNMATRGQAFVVRENIREEQVLIVLVSAAEDVGWAEASVVNVWACPIPSDSVYPGEELYPC